MGIRNKKVEELPQQHDPTTCLGDVRSPGVVRSERGLVAGEKAVECACARRVFGRMDAADVILSRVRRFGAIFRRTGADTTLICRSLSVAEKNLIWVFTGLAAV